MGIVHLRLCYWTYASCALEHNHCADFWLYYLHACLWVLNFFWSCTISCIWWWLFTIFKFISVVNKAQTNNPMYYVPWCIIVQGYYMPCCLVVKLVCSPDSWSLILWVDNTCKRNSIITKQPYLTMCIFTLSTSCLSCDGIYLLVVIPLTHNRA